MFALVASFHQRLDCRGVPLLELLDAMAKRLRLENGKQASAVSSFNARPLVRGFAKETNVVRLQPSQELSRTHCLHSNPSVKLHAYAPDVEVAARRDGAAQVTGLGKLANATLQQAEYVYVNSDKPHFAHNVLMVISSGQWQSRAVEREVKHACFSHPQCAMQSITLSLLIPPTISSSETYSHCSLVRQLLRHGGCWPSYLQVSKLAAALSNDPSLLFLRLPSGVLGRQFFANEVLNVEQFPAILFFPKGSDRYCK